MMMTRWTGSMSLLFALLAALVWNQALDVSTAHAQDAEAEKASKDAPADPKTRAPHTCPLIPIAVYGGDSLYEAHYFADDTCTSPTLTYAYGSYSYPQTCPNCSTYTTRPKFYGLAMPVPADYKHLMPTGRPYQYSKKAPTPNNITYLYLERKGVYVKVFAFLVNRKDMASGAAPVDANFKETIYFAFECSDPKSIGVDVTRIDEVHESKQRGITDLGGAATTVYDVTYDYAGGPAHILTFLCGDPEPPVDQPVPVADDQ